MLLKILRLHYIQALFQSRLFNANYAYLIVSYHMTQLQLSLLNDREFDRRKVKVYYILYIWLCRCLFYQHIHPLDFVRLLLVACTFNYVIVCIQTIENGVQITGRYAP
jgi:hypothetical protein